MSFIYQGKQGWIKQAARNVQTFRSGLCLIKLEYISRKSSINYYDFKVGDRLSEEDSMPCIDGAFIFPEPSYNDMGNGFMKCTVTAYGRVNISGVVDLSKRIGDYINYIVEYYIDSASPTTNTKTSSQRFFDFVIYRFISREGEFVSPPPTPMLYIYDLNGTVLPQESSTSTAPGNEIIDSIIYSGTTRNIPFLGRQITTYETTNYGVFNEVIISVSAIGNLRTTTTWTPNPI